jgi:hypothetical protein
MRTLRIRSALLCSFAVGAAWWFSGSASALDAGPIAVPVQLSSNVAVTVPPAVTVGPVSVPVAKAAPGLGASVRVSPQTGVGASVSLPSSIGPLPVLPGAPHAVKVGIGPAGATVTAPATVQVGAPPSNAASTSPRVRSGTSGAPASRVAPLEVHAADVGRRASALWRSPGLPARPGAVNASLQHQSPGGVWSLLHDLTSARVLWIALLLIAAIARFAAGGLLHDAFRRRADVSAT